jgi:hypothetical protein
MEILCKRNILISKMILLNTKIRYLITSIKNTAQFICEVQYGDKLYSG